MSTPTESTQESKPATTRMTLTRRGFIAAGGLAAGGLVLGVFGSELQPPSGDPASAASVASVGVLTWIEISADNQVTALVPHCEMGQGALTGLGMMLAEELEADWSRLRIVEAPAKTDYANAYFLRGFVNLPMWLANRITRLASLQPTGGSSSLRSTGQLGMRIAGAAAKQMLLAAAAARWQVAVTECVAERSIVRHAASGRSATYGELAPEAAKLDPPEKPALKERAAYTIVGTSPPRPDLPGKVDGTAQYGIDAVLPDMLYAAVIPAPVPGSTLASVDASEVNAMPGVQRVVQLEDAVAVVASGFWQAQQAVRALRLTFTEVKGSRMDSAQLWAQHRALLDNDDARRKFRRGKGAAALSKATRSVTAEYQVPYLAHATMEPMSALVHMTESRCEVWSGSQDPLHARRTAARAAGMDGDDVIMHNQLLGGGFGRRLPGSLDYIDQAVRIAKKLSPRPVKMIWNRETDMRSDYYRPASLARFRGGLDAQSQLTTWCCDFTGPGGNAARPIYAVEHQEIRSARAPKHLRVGAWRSVEHSSHGFFVESFVDEVAHAAGQDPLQYRRALLAGKPRHIEVLDRVAKMSSWGSPLPKGQARGVAIVESFGSIVAEVAVVAIDAAGSVAVRDVFAAVDCGLVVHPDAALAQVEGGIVFGLSAAMFQEITIANGGVEQASFPDFPMITLANSPRVHVELIDSYGPMGGIGEVGVPPIAPAVTNAIFAASGYRVRALPVKNHKIVAA